MFVANLTVSLLLAALLAASAYRKLTRDPAILESVRRVNFPEAKLPWLAGLLLAGAAGLVLGLVWRPIGVAAAAGVLAYFLTTLAFHVRAKDLAHAPSPLVFAALAGAAFGLQLASP